MFSQKKQLCFLIFFWKNKKVDESTQYPEIILKKVTKFLEIYCTIIIINIYASNENSD